MTKIQFVKKNLTAIIAVLLLVLFVVSMIVISGSIKREQRLIYESMIGTVRVNVEDSVRTIEERKFVKLMDSVQVSERSKSNTAVAKAYKWEAVASTYKASNQKLRSHIDSMVVNPGCDSIVTAYDGLVDSITLEKDAMQEQINELDMALTADSIGWDACVKENKSKDLTIARKDAMNDLKDNMNLQLTKELERKSSFLNRYGWTISGGLAFFFGILIAK